MPPGRAHVRPLLLAAFAGGATIWSPGSSHVGSWSCLDQVSGTGWSAGHYLRADPGSLQTTPTVLTAQRAVRWPVCDQDSRTVGRLATSSGGALVATGPLSGARRRGWSPQGQVEVEAGLLQPNLARKLVPARPPFSPDARDWLHYDQLAPEAGPILTTLAVTLVAPRPTSPSSPSGAIWGGRSATSSRANMVACEPARRQSWSRADHVALALVTARRPAGAGRPLETSRRSPAPPPLTRSTATLTHRRATGKPTRCHAAAT